MELLPIFRVPACAEDGLGEEVVDYRGLRLALNGEFLHHEMTVRLNGDSEQG